MIELQQVRVENREEILLNLEHFQLNTGDFTILFGGEAQSRTALLHLVMGFETQYTGTVTLFGKNPTQLTELDRMNVRFIPDSIIWEKHITAEQYFAQSMDRTAGYAEELMNKLCRKYKLPVREELLNMTYRQNKLVQIINAICAGPQVLLLDNPYHYLDNPTYRQVMRDLAGANKAGMTILLAAEQFADGGSYCKKYCYMKAGEIAFQGKVSAIYSDIKVVTTTGGDERVLRKYMDYGIRKEGRRTTYVFVGSTKNLLDALTESGCEDFTVENITLEEQLDLDFSRWE